MMDLDILVRGNLDELFQLRAMSLSHLFGQTITTLADLTFRLVQKGQPSTILSENVGW